MSKGLICDICKQPIDTSKKFIKCEMDTIINNDKVSDSKYLDFHCPGPYDATVSLNCCCDN